MAFFSRFKSPQKRKAPAPKARLTVAATTEGVSPPERRPHERDAKPRLPRFHTTASDHVERDRGDRFARERVKIRNAFTPAQPVVDSRMFAGRSKTLMNMIRAVEDQRMHLVIFGERGVGKTSLLQMLSMAAREARYIVVYVSCGATSDFSETFRTVAAEIPLIYHSGVSPISAMSDAGKTLLDILGSGRVAPRQFADAAAKLVGTRVIVMLDEFDRTGSAEFRRDIAELIKTLSDMSARVQLVIAGVAGDLVDLMEQIPSIRRSVSALQISAMAEQEVRELIANGERSSGIAFEAPAADYVVAAACGSPYLANLVCHLAGLAALDAGRVRIAAKDVATAVDAAMDDFRRRLPADVANQLDAIADAVFNTMSKGSRRSAAAGAVDTRSPREMEMATALENSGLLEKLHTSRYMLIMDSLVPYLQLKQSRDRFAASNEPAQAAIAAN